MLLTASNTAASPSGRLRSFSCGVDGFKGTIQIDFRGPSSTRAEYIYFIYYKIDKGPNRGGNNANVWVNDSGTRPIKRFYTGNGIQDNRSHVLAYRYSRGSGPITAGFTFDKSLASDPSCNPSINIR
jgi:hypothetical protein